MLTILIGCLVSLSVICLAAMGYALYRSPRSVFAKSDYLKLGFSGLIAFLADTFGLDSFSVNAPLSRCFGSFRNEELPGALNGAQVLPGTIEALFFMQLVEVDMLTLLVLVAGTCIGSLLGNRLMPRLCAQKVRLSMMAFFMVLIALLFACHFGLVPLGGEAMSLVGGKLIFGFIAMMLCGALTSVGIGLFVMIQCVLFLMNVSPDVAFPIMTTAGALQQPITSLMLLKQGRIPLKKTMILSLSGCIGVMIALPIFNVLSSEALRGILAVVLIYHVLSMGYRYFRTRRPYVAGLGLGQTNA